MTIIELKQGYFIKAKQRSYTLMQRYEGKAKTGERKIGERKIGHYGDVSQCLKAYLERCQMDVLDGERVTLEEYVGIIETTNKIALHGLRDVLERFEVK